MFDPLSFPNVSISLIQASSIGLIVRISHVFVVDMEGESALNNHDANCLLAKLRGVGMAGHRQKIKIFRGKTTIYHFNETYTDIIKSYIPPF